MFFLNNEKVIIATPDDLDGSERTIDTSSEDLANDYETQLKAKMLSAIFIHPEAFWANPMPPEDRRRHMASYLASLKDCKEGQDKVYEYISQNGQLRILFLQS